MTAKKRIKSKVDTNAASVESTVLFGSWLPPESAPLNGTLILGDFGWPWPLPAVWDTYDEQWCVATVQASPMKDGADNYWLETETESKSQLKRWMPMPSLPNARMSDAPLQPSDSPSALQAHSSPSAGSGNPGITAARETQKEPGGERAEFPKPTN